MPGFNCDNSGTMAWQVHSNWKPKPLGVKVYIVPTGKQPRPTEVLAEVRGNLEQWVVEDGDINCQL